MSSTSNSPPPPPQRGPQSTNQNNNAGGPIPRTNNLVIQNQGQGQTPVVPTRTTVSTILNQNQHFQMLAAFNNMSQSPPPQNYNQNTPPSTPPRQSVLPPNLQTHQFQINGNSSTSTTTSSSSSPPRSPISPMTSPNVQRQQMPPPPPRTTTSPPQSPNAQRQQQQQQLPPPAPRRGLSSTTNQQQPPPNPVRQYSQNSQQPPPPPNPVRQYSQNSQKQLPPNPVRQYSQNSQHSQQLPPNPVRQYSQNSQHQQMFNNSNNYSSGSGGGNVQVNDQSGLSQRKQLPKPPEYDPNPNSHILRSKSSLSRSASTLKNKFANMMNRVPSLRRTFSTKENSKTIRKKRLNVSGGIGVSTMYENSKKGKPIFENQLLKKPQNPNFIISLGIIVMIAAVTLSIALIAKYSGGLSEENIHDITEVDIQGLIFFSLFLFIIAVTGCVAYYQKWASLLLTFSVFIVFAFIVQLIIILLFLSIYTNPVVQMRYKWVDGMTDNDKIDFQDNNSCCGFLSIADAVISTKCYPDDGQIMLTKFPEKLVIKSNVLESKFEKRQWFDPFGGDGGAGGDPAVDNTGAGGDTGADPAVDAGAGAGGDTGADPTADTGAGGDTGNTTPDTQTTTTTTNGATTTTTDNQLVENASATNTTNKSTENRDPNSYTEADVQPEGCANVIVRSIKTGLIQYIITESIMALLFIVALYFAYIHFKEQILMPKKLNLDAAKITFG